MLGRSNVGKSSLINALAARRALARTSRSPGKTRLCNVFNVGDRFYLVDLPGYGYASVSHTERQRFRRLLERYVHDRPSVAGIVWLLDIRRDPSRDDLAFAAALAAAGRPVLAALTKADKLPRARRGAQVQHILSQLGLADAQCVVTSARTGDGIAELRAAIRELVAA